MKHPYVKHPRAAADTPWSVPALCTAYDWPADLAGGGVIGIYEAGGFWKPADMAAFFKSINQPEPEITDISVDGTENGSVNIQDAEYEVALDIQVSAAAYYAATGKAATIRVYWAQDMSRAVTAAVKDKCSVLSISWGDDEAAWASADVTNMVNACEAASSAGMIVMAASGDNDSSDGGAGAANVDFPASCPSVLGCGGTTKTASSEVVWNNNPGQTTGEGTGGGYSTLFALPTWQTGIPTPPKLLGRMVPDVAGNADPNTGYEIFVDGSSEVVGGTSAVAPLYAGLLAAAGKDLGFVNAKLFADSSIFEDITSGDNGAYEAQTGPDPCTGLGSPKGAKIAALFAGSVAPPAPTPAPPQPPEPTPEPPSPKPPAPTMSKHEFYRLCFETIHRAYNEPAVTVEQMARQVELICIRALTK